GAVIVGFWSSLSVTVWVAVAVLPWISVTVQVTVVWPTGNDAGASLLTLCTPQLSLVTGVPRSTFMAEQLPLSATGVTSAGAVIVGFWSSLTVTVWVAVAVLPWISVTVQVTVVWPTGNDAGASLLTLCTPQLSS